MINNISNNNNNNNKNNNSNSNRVALLTIFANMFPQTNTKALSSNKRKSV